MKKIFCSIMVVALVLAMFAGCGSKGNDFTCADVVNSGANQQRWLKSYESNLVINPNAIGAETYTDPSNDMSLDLGILAEDGSVAKTLDDVVFFLETSLSNGKGGEEVWVADFTPGSENVRGLTRFANNTSDGRMLAGVNELANGIDVKSKSKITLDFVTPYYFVFELISIGHSDPEEEVDTRLCFSGPFLGSFLTDIAEPGVYVADMNASYIVAFDNHNADEGKDEVFDPSVPVSLTPYFHIPEGTSIVVGNCAIKTIDLAFQYATGAMKNTWYPYQIVSSQSYEYGTALKTTDMITSATAITRKVECELAGSVYTAGYLNGGTATVDAKNGLVTVNGDGFEYTVCVKRTGDVTFYDSEADMLANVNGSAEPTANSQYWVMTQNSYSVGDAFNIGVSASLTAGATLADAKDAASAATLKKFEANAAADWDAFIADNDVTEYIVNIPESK